MSAPTIPTLSTDLVGASSEELFTAVYAQYRDMVRWTIISKLSRPDFDLADDLTQETFLKLYRHRDRIEFGPRIAGLLKVMARQSIGNHYAVMRNTREVPTDTGDWSCSNRSMAPTGAGYYTPAETGFRTARIGGAK